ncbi:MAG: AAA family ATPase [Planctomycetia bacterium]|nr:AAA family ATPase [Planctomycetia bacterium]
MIPENLPIPQPGEPIPWTKLEDSLLSPEINRMKETPQDPLWHPEGNVWTHTQMVLDVLTQSEEWKNASSENRSILFLAALLHDLGKLLCTRTENSRIISPNHGRIGAKYAREILWKRFQMAGSKESQRIRETICSLIRFHSSPVHFLDSDHPEYLVLRPASDGDTALSMSNRLLAALVHADLNGRGKNTDSISSSLEALELYRQMAEEYECLDGPFPFSSPWSRFTYFSKRTEWPRTDLFDNSWGEVILLSALPGTGKDTYYRNHLSDRPMISLDTIREEMKIAPEANQNAVAGKARDRAKEFLRIKQPFVWNATNISDFIRGSVVRLCMDYGASVRIIFLEASWEETLKRNKSRKKAVPESVLDHLLAKLEPPSVREAPNVDWIIS